MDLQTLNQHYKYMHTNAYTLISLSQNFWKVTKWSNVDHNKTATYRGHTSCKTHL